MLKLVGDFQQNFYKEKAERKIRHTMAEYKISEDAAIAKIEIINRQKKQPTRLNEIF